jgi:hypothetical protein
VGHPKLFYLGHLAKLRNVPAVAAVVGKGRYLVGLPLQGIAALQKKAPNLEFFGSAVLVDVESGVENGQFRVVPRSEQLDAPYDQLYTLQAADLIQDKAYAEGRLHLERAIATRPSNAVARRLLEKIDRITTGKPPAQQQSP